MGFGVMRSALACFGVTLVLGLGAACSSEDDDHAPPAGSLGGRSSGGSSTSGGKSSSGGTTSSGGDAGETGSGGSSASSGSGSGGVPASCGDGIKDDPEECDGTDFRLTTCADFGFDDGTLACNGDCTADPSGCSGTEHCGDGRDNDGDGLVDCEDETDCSAACAAPCSAPEVLEDPAQITASTNGRSDAVNSTCSTQSSVNGPDSVYQIVAANAGMLEVELDTDALMHVSVRDDCTDGPAELACDFQFLSVPVNAGDTMYVVVESYSPVDVGSFTLRVMSRGLNVCSDGYRDPLEDCDDGNDDPYDACDTSCNLASDETEDNGTTGTADAYHDSFWASISPSADVDVFEIDVPVGPGSISASIQGMLDECVRGKADSFVEILNSGGTALKSNDNVGDSFCSDVVSSGLAAGTYYVRVSASSASSTLTFPYQLIVNVNTCGDGVLGPGEQCDDADQTPGDGCDASCQTE